MSRSNPYDQDTQRDRYRAIFQCELTERHDAGQIDDDEFVKVLHASDRDRIVDKMIAESENPQSSDQFIGEFSWDNIVQWIKDNWITILKLVLTVFLLFLDEKPETD